MDISTDIYDKWLKKCRKQVECIYDLDKEIGSDFNSINILRGIFLDNWCGELVDFEIKVEKNGVLVLKGYYPKELHGNEIVHVCINKHKKLDYHLKDNKFMIKAPIKKNNQIVRVSFKCNFSFKADEPDIRILSFIMNNVIIVY